MTFQENVTAFLLSFCDRDDTSLNFIGRNLVNNYTIMVIGKKSKSLYSLYNVIIDMRSKTYVCHCNCIVKGQVHDFDSFADR